MERLCGGDAVEVPPGLARVSCFLWSDGMTQLSARAKVDGLGKDLGDFRVSEAIC
jgi:hypothetical protein